VKNTAKPTFQFLKTSFQIIGIVPDFITLNIFPKVTYEAPKEPNVNKTKITFSRLDNKY